MQQYDVSVNHDGIRREDLDGREHLVVPVKAVEEGVLDGGLLPAETIEESEPGWNGVPAVAGHPTDGANFISANQPDVHSNLSFGRFFEAEAQDGEMTGELWLDVEKARHLDDDGFEVPMQAIEKLESGEDVAVSTSYIPTSREEDPGRYDGQPYQHVLRSIQPDHIGVLPDGQGRDPNARTLVANTMRSITNSLGTVLTNSDSGADNGDGDGETAANEEPMPEDIDPEDLSLQDHVAPYLASVFGVSDEEVTLFVDAMNPEEDENTDAVLALIESSDAIDADALADELAGDDGGEADDEGEESGDGAGEGEAAANQADGLTDFTGRVAANSPSDESERKPSFGSFSTRRNTDSN